MHPAPVCRLAGATPVAGAAPNFPAFPLLANPAASAARDLAYFLLLADSADPADRAARIQSANPSAGRGLL